MSGTNDRTDPASAQTAPSKQQPVQRTSVKWKFNGWGWSTSILGVILIVVVAGGFYFHFFRSSPTSPPPPAAQTEAQFHNSVAEANGSSDLAGEWRLARSDHKIIAYAIARCLGVVDAETMPKPVFSMLMLDLRPNGDHWWNVADPPPPQNKFKQLTGYEAAILAISDEVARARLAATGGATKFFPFMFWFGWLSVVVSAVATALVTLKASLSGNSYPRWSMTIGVLAVLLSTTATVLTGAKQFWDPTNAYMRNETALLALRQLHAEIALTFIAGWDADKCQAAGGADGEASFPKWRSTLVSLESGTMSAPVIVATQNGSATQSVAPAPPPQQPGGTQARPGEKAAAENK